MAFVPVSDLCGFAATIKPLVVPAAFLFLLFACVILRRLGERNGAKPEQKRMTSFLLAAGAGSVVPICAVILFFLHGSTFAPFVAIATGMTRLYVNNGNMPFSFMLHTALGAPLDLLLLICIYISLRTSSWLKWQYTIVLLGACAGALLFFGQRKGFQYHKLSLVGFVILWISLQLFAGIRRQPHIRWMSATGLVILCFFLIHNWMLPTLSYGYAQPAVEQLESDLRLLGGSRLSGEVQCIESVDGCINALYDMRLVQSTGFIFDAFIFTLRPASEVPNWQAIFLSKMTQHPPKVLIVMQSSGYERVGTWPVFSDFLKNNYLLQTEKVNLAQFAGMSNYRLYVHK